MDPEYERRLTPKKIIGSTRLAPGSPRTPTSRNSSPRRCLALSPNRERPGDRFIPFRAGARWDTNFAQLKDSNKSSGEGWKDRMVYNTILQNELFGVIKDNQAPDTNNKGTFSSPTRKPTLYSFSPRKKNKKEETSAPFSLSPITNKSQKMLLTPRKIEQKISRAPFKVLDAPDLQDDFYLNLLDWSAQNIVSVGLGTSAYLWSGITSGVTCLCDISSERDTITSVKFSEKGNLLAIGTHRGLVNIWDVETQKLTCTLRGHTSRVSAMDWNMDVLSSGSRDRFILQRDTRSSSVSADRRLAGHFQEVCGLKWSPDNQYLASGGNDNKLLIWSQHTLSPVQAYSEHNAAVKAIAWSPHQYGLLASGGGKADRNIRFWNTITGQQIQSVEMGSQICNLAWSKHASELVSTHGYSENQILVWKYPSLVQVAKLTGHTYRVLYLAMSPTGEDIVTGAGEGDSTLRFWNIFNKSKDQGNSKSVLNLCKALR